MEIVKDDAALWWESRNTPIQDYEEPDPIPVEELEPEPAEVEPVTAQDVRNHANSIKLNSHAAGIIVGLQDTITPIIICLVLKSVEKDDLKLTDDEQDLLTEAWAAYLAEKEVELSPGWGLVITIVLIYSAKITEASQKAKMRTKIQEQEDEIEQLRQECERLNNEKEILIKQSWKQTAEKHKARKPVAPEPEAKTETEKQN